MKKLNKSILLTIVIFSFSTIIFANSGPVFWQGYPASDIMSIKANSPITVKNEKLVFDFSNYDESDYTISGKVRAAYSMANPTKETQLVQMAFPFVGTLYALSPESVVITADNIILPYDLYLGDVVDIRGNPRYEKDTNFDFANILNAITEEAYKAEGFEDSEKGKLYTIEVKPNANEIVNFVVSFNGNRTKVLANGFNSYERNNDIIKSTALCDKPTTLEVFVLGEDIGIFTNTYIAGKAKGKTDLLTCQISTQEVEFKSYFMDYIKSHTNASLRGMTSDTQLYNLYAKALDRCFKANMGYSSEYDLMAQGDYKRIMTLVYTVEFPKDSEKEISVSYNTSGTMDKTETAKPLYSFDYILNPATNWRDFKNLNIEIITPKQAPYIVKSSVDLIKGENKLYTATLTDLPAEDLSFTLYADEKITLLDKAAGNLQNSFEYFAPFEIVASVLLLGIIIIVIIVKRNKNK
jgi:hypothetical protein